MKGLKTWLIVAIFSFGFFGFSQNSSQKLENYIINGDKNNAFKELQKKQKNAQYYQLKRILDGKASYNDYFEFTSKSDRIGKSQHEQLNDFFEKIKKPLSSIKINMDYVKIKWIQISNLRNEISLPKANKENNKLRAYINQFPTKSKDVIRANMYADVNDIVIYGIESKLEKSKAICEKNIRVANRLNDTLLVIMNKFFFK